MKILIIFFLYFFLNTPLQAQYFEWIKPGGGNGIASISSEMDEVIKLATDDNGNIYGIGRTTGSFTTLDTFNRFLNFDYEGESQNVLYSFDKNGILRWAKLIESSSTSDCHALKYNNGKIFVSGNMPGEEKRIGDDEIIEGGLFDYAFLLCYDTSGEYQWLKFIGEDNNESNFTSASMWTSAIFIDNDSYIHYLKYLKNGIRIDSTTVSTRGTYELIYNPIGVLVEVKKINLDSSICVFSAVVDESTGNLYGIGFLPEEAGNYNTYVVALDHDRDILWIDTVYYDDGSGNYSQVANIAIDHDKNLYIVGAGFNAFTYKGSTIANPFTMGPMSVVIKTDIDGNILWQKSFSYLSDNVNYDITVLPDGSVATAGLFSGKLITENDTLTCPVSEGQNGFLAIMSKEGTLLEYEQMHGTGFYDRINAITSDKQGNIYLGGSFSIDIWADSIMPVSMVGGGNRDYFTAKYNFENAIDTNVTSIVDRQHTHVDIYPNPVSSQLNIKGLPYGSAYIFNSNGRLTYSSIITPGNTQLNTSHLLPGLYMLVLCDNKTTILRKKFIKL